MINTLDKDSSIYKIRLFLIENNSPSDLIFLLNNCPNIIESDIKYYACKYIRDNVNNSQSCDLLKAITVKMEFGYEFLLETLESNENSLIGRWIGNFIFKTNLSHISYTICDREQKMYDIMMCQEIDLLDYSISEAQDLGLVSLILNNKYNSNKVMRNLIQYSKSPEVQLLVANHVDASVPNLKLLYRCSSASFTQECLEICIHKISRIIKLKSIL